MMLDRKNIQITIGEMLYYTFWIIMLTLKALGFQEGMLIYNIGLIVSFVSILLKILLEKHCFYEWFAIVFLLALGGIIYLSSGEKSPLVYTMMVIGIKKVSVRKVFYIGLPIWGSCFLYRVLISITGIDTGYVFAHEKLGLGPILRWDFGYAHPNVLQISYAVFTAFALFISKKKGKELLKLAGVLFLGNCYVFLYSVSYTGVILVSLCIIIFVYFERRNNFTKVELIFMKGILPFCVIFSIVGPLLTEKGMIFQCLDSIMNQLLNNRFLASRLYLYRGLSLFGRTQMELDISFALDCSYVLLLIRYGVIFFSLILIGYSAMINHYIKNLNRKELALIFSFLIAGISEPFLFNSSFKNLIFILLGNYCFSLIHRFSEKREFGFSFSNKILIEISDKLFLDFDKGLTVFKQKKKSIITMGIIMGILFAVCHRYFAIVPDSIFVDKGFTDCTPQKEVNLDIRNLPENFNSLVYDYQGKDSPMYEFAGNMIVLEDIRGSISWGLIGVGIGCVFMYLIWRINLCSRQKREYWR